MRAQRTDEERSADVRDVVKVFEEGVAAGRGPEGGLARRRAGRGRRARGAFGVGQDHAALDHGLHPHAHRRAGSTVDGQARAPGPAGALRDVRRRKIGFVFQQFNLFPALTALENVEYALNVKGGRGAAAREEAAARARAGGPRRPARLPAARPLGRPEAARGHRAGAGGLAARAPGRRAHGQPGHRGGRRRSWSCSATSRRARGRACGRHARPEGAGGRGPRGGDPGRAAGGVGEEQAA